MSGLNIMTVYGTRPEAIKMAPLIAGLRDQPSLHPAVAVNTLRLKIIWATTASVLRRNGTTHEFMERGEWSLP